MRMLVTLGSVHYKLRIFASFSLFREFFVCFFLFFLCFLDGKFRVLRERNFVDVD